MQMKRNIIRLTFCSLIAALSVSIMLLSGVFSVFSYAIPMLSSILMLSVVIETDKGWAFITYLTVSIFSMLLVPNKEAALMYTAFFGFYPILKAVFENSVRIRFFSYILKLAVFNLTMVAVFYIGLFLLGIPKAEYEIFGIYLPGLILAVGNFAFVLYDILLTRTVLVYIKKIKPYLDRTIFK